MFGEQPLEAGHGHGARRTRADEGLIRAGEGSAHRLDRTQVCRDGACHVARPHLVLLEREVDDAVCLADRRAQAIKVVEIAPPHLGTQRSHDGGRTA
jgi:hypothetical protein